MNNKKDTKEDLIKTYKPVNFHYFKEAILELEKKYKSGDIITFFIFLEIIINYTGLNISLLELEDSKKIHFDFGLLEDIFGDLLLNGYESGDIIMLNDIKTIIIKMK